MQTSLEPARLISYVAKQLQNFFPDEQEHDLSPVIHRAMERLEHCFANVALPGYRKHGKVVFNHLHSDQNAVFLYFASNTAWRDMGDIKLASKLFYLNRTLNGIICMYDTELPSIFLLVHSVGITLGKASYSDYLVVHQNVTVGNDRGFRPRLDKHVVLCGGASIIGDCDISSAVSISANSTVLHTAIPAGHIVAGRSPDLIVKPARRQLIEQYFDIRAQS